MNIHQQYGKAYQKLENHIMDHGPKFVLDAVIHHVELPTLLAMIRAIEKELKELES